MSISKVIHSDRQRVPMLPHLAFLEAQAIHIMREVSAEFRKPVMLYSVGKDSSVMLHLARKAFFPAKVPFPLLHIDTSWKFKEMTAFRDDIAVDMGLEMIVHSNREAIARGVNPFNHGLDAYTRVMKTDALKGAISFYGFDAAFGGARRDEERSRAKERIFSFRNRDHSWNPKSQRPELWDLYNCKIAKGETIRVFPLSNWTEADVWQYIHVEDIPVVPLYFAKKRPVVQKNGSLIMVDDDRLPIGPEDKVEERLVRFRTLGCYPLTAAFESHACNVPEIILEISRSHLSERNGRLIDTGGLETMETKKREGYF